MVSEIQPGQTFSSHPPAHPNTMDENNTPTALKGCGVKNEDLFITFRVIVNTEKHTQRHKLVEVIME